MKWDFRYLQGQTKGRLKMKGRMKGQMEGRANWEMNWGVVACWTFLCPPVVACCPLLFQVLASTMGLLTLGTCEDPIYDDAAVWSRAKQVCLGQD